jgi:hypothetical protein
MAKLKVFRYIGKPVACLEVEEVKDCDFSTIAGIRLKQVVDIITKDEERWSDPELPLFGFDSHDPDTQSWTNGKFNFRTWHGIGQDQIFFKGNFLDWFQKLLVSIREELSKNELLGEKAKQVTLLDVNHAQYSYSIVAKIKDYYCNQ